MLTSFVCCHAHFHTDWYARWAAALRLPKLPHEDAQGVYLRKAWEYAAIAQALDERGLLSPGRRGVGFAVGREPLASAFAARGVEVVATDLGVGASDPGWGATGQHAASVEAIFKPDIVDRAAFDRHVRFQPADMRAIAGLAPESFDFVWSSCAMEHLGTLAAGQRFVAEAMKLLKPGGVAVHTTEYNVSSNAGTVGRGGNVLYRRRDVEALGDALRLLGGALHTVDFDAGTHQYDIDYDYVPFLEHGRQHIKLLLDGYVSTSMLLIVTRGQVPPAVALRRPPVGWRLRALLPAKMRPLLRWIRRLFTGFTNHHKH